MNEPKHAQFVLSYELLCLLQWLVSNDEERLRKIIQKAYLAGLYKELDHLEHNARNLQHLEQMQESVIDFLNMLEQQLATVMQEQTQIRAQHHNLMPSIDKLDVNECDDATVQHSLEKATARAERSPQTNTKTLLFEEFLRRWKPHGGTVVN